MQTNHINKPMKSISQSLLFILWGISTIIITGLIFVVLPITSLWEKFAAYIGRDAIMNDASESVT